MRLAKMSENDHGFMLVSSEFTNGEFKFRFVLRVQYTEKYDSEWSRECGRYHVELLAVSPERAGDHLQSALKAQGCTPENGFPVVPELAKFEVLVEEGIVAKFWQDTSNNLDKLLRAGRIEMKDSSMTFAVRMDEPQNGCRATGWDTIAGRICPCQEDTD